jgi:endonuclease/exonuclease/phosphatase family metal-dependent hydrolase
MLDLITYNVCWECMTGTSNVASKAAEYGGRCACVPRRSPVAGRSNRCFANVVRILSHRAFDVIAIQEGSHALAAAVRAQLERAHRTTYGVVIRNTGRAVAIVLYKRATLMPLGDAVLDLVYVRGNGVEGRPMMAQRFATAHGTLAVVACHCPHERYVLPDNLRRVLTRVGSAAGDDVVVIGDFNRAQRRSIRVEGRRGLLRPCNRMATAWNVHGEGYRAAVDNVLVSDRLRPHRVETLSNAHTLLPLDARLRNLTSDHTPVAAQLGYAP